MTTKPPAAYWEDRARLFAAEGEGLRAVCSYGMPAFYNRFIDLTQRLALNRWLVVERDEKVLDVGCGVGRWSRLLARKGARVTGVDLSATMIDEARRRAVSDGISDRCTFQVGDLADLARGERFSLVLAVTVLQHILDEDRLESAISRLAGHLTAEGRMVLLEAAPTHSNASCDTAIFQARTASDYRQRFERCGLRLETVHGVDPAPFKVWLLPFYRRMPSFLGKALLAAATAASLPVDALFGRALTSVSWHKVFVLKKASR